MSATTYYGQTSSTIWGPTLLRSPSASATSSSSATTTTTDTGTNTSNGDTNLIEVSVHTFPKPLQREFQHVFGDNVANNSSLLSDDDNDNGTQAQQTDCEYLAIPTNQPAREDLVSVGPKVQEEKDRLLNAFMAFAQILCDALGKRGYWCDYIDPCSGLPMVTMQRNKVYSEVDGIEALLGYKSYNAGFCKILQHPKWGTSVYPATVFAYAPRNLLVKLLQTEFRNATTTSAS